jgi:hypothetical protein
LEPTRSAPNRIPVAQTPIRSCIGKESNGVEATPAQLDGKPIDFRGLRRAPTDEQGVVGLSGMVGRELGFYAEAN